MTSLLDPEIKTRLTAIYVSVIILLVFLPLLGIIKVMFSDTIKVPNWLCLTAIVLQLAFVGLLIIYNQKAILMMAIFLSSPTQTKQEEEFIRSKAKKATKN